MIKILHTADWHLGKWLDNVSRLPEQKEVMEEICEIAEKEDVKVVLIAGDLFDTANPSAEAATLFYKSVHKLASNGKRVVIAIAGNHDQPDRIEAPDHLAHECGIIFIGYPNTKVETCDRDSYSITKSDYGFLEIQFKDGSPPVRVLHTPYANELRLKTNLGMENEQAELRSILQQSWQSLVEKYCDDKGVNLLCTHLFFGIKGQSLSDEPEDEKPILFVGGAEPVYSENIPTGIQYVAVGHLHRYQVIDTNPCPIVYSSSPLPYSFSEAGQDKYVVIINAQPGKEVQFDKQKLQKGKKLLRQRFEAIQDAISWLNENQDALVEITIVSDTFLTARDRRQLHDAHSAIINIIPEVRTEAFKLNSAGTIDINKSMEALFIDYFHHENGQQPSDEIMHLFKEALATES